MGLYLDLETFGPLDGAVIDFIILLGRFISKTVSTTEYHFWKRPLTRWITAKCFLCVHLPSHDDQSKIHNLSRRFVLCGGGNVVYASIDPLCPIPILIRSHTSPSTISVIMNGCNRLCCRVSSQDDSIFVWKSYFEVYFGYTT